MKTLAYMETHKLHRYIQAQNSLVGNIEEMANDFLYFHPDVLPSTEPSETIYLLIGSQRGFCGNFNELLVGELKSKRQMNHPPDCRIIAIGQKLHPLLENLGCDTTAIEGANVSEEISSVVSGAVNVLIANQHQLITLYVLHHAEDGHVHAEKLLPPFTASQKPAADLRHPPVLNMPAKQFFLDLIEHYLFINLHRLLFASLMAENQSRILHLNNAINHLDDKTTELQRKSNALRQEEIIEEIEVILLNTSSL
jgi:F-type H+-transporting ATPase subunit gamma